MKKIYILLAFGASTFFASAQDRGALADRPSHSPFIKQVMAPSANRAGGDTLMYMPLSNYSINATDAPSFQLETYDGDGLTPNYGSTYPVDFGVFYSTDSSIYGMSCSACSTPHSANYYHPWETPAPAGTDTTRFWSATSWFTDGPLAGGAGTADNWLMFGPITVPAAGATILWYERFNRYRDGYQVLVQDGSIVSTPIAFTDFDASTPVYTLTDDPAPSATYATDTMWTLRTANVPAALNGGTAIFAFHHTAVDQDVLRLDEITVIEKLPLGINEAASKGVVVSQNSPNPFSSVSTINYELQNNSSVMLSVYDVTGKKVAEQVMGSQNAGKHSIEFNASDLSAGVYYYSLKVNDANTATMKMVIMK
jgi:hypothetical protein